MRKNSEEKQAKKTTSTKNCGGSQKSGKNCGSKSTKNCK